MTDEIEEPEVEAEVEAPAPQEDGLAELKRQLDAERLSRQDAERVAHSARQEANVARADMDDTNVKLVQASIKTLEGNGEQHKANLKSAWAAGDFDTAAEIQQAMADTAADLAQLRNGLTELTKPKPPAFTDPVDALAAAIEKGGSPKAAVWIRNHPEYARDQRLNRKMVRAHEDALEDGLRVDTPEYFAFVEDRLGLRPKVETEEETLSEAAAPVRPRSPPAAPPNRGGRPRNGVTTLTAAEREAAEISGRTLEEYAANKEWLLKNNPNYGKAH